MLTLDLLAHAKAEREKTEAEEKANTASGYDANDPLVAEILSLIEARKQAKKDKNYAEADRIRNDLQSRGITLIDTPQGTTFKIES